MGTKDKWVVEYLIYSLQPGEPKCLVASVLQGSPGSAEGHEVAMCSCPMKSQSVGQVIGMSDMVALLSLIRKSNINWLRIGSEQKVGQRRHWRPTPVLLPGNFHGWRSLVGCSPWDRWVGHDWATSLSLFTFTHWRRKWQPTPVFLPGESQGWRNLVGCRLWGRTESDTTDVT